MYVPNPLLLKKKLDIGSSFPVVRLCAGYGIMAIGFMANTYPSQCGIFSCLICRSNSSSCWISLRWNWSMFSCISDISVGSGKVSHVTILIQSSHWFLIVLVVLCMFLTLVFSWSYVWQYGSRFHFLYNLFWWTQAFHCHEVDLSILSFVNCVYYFNLGTLSYKA